MASAAAEGAASGTASTSKLKIRFGGLGRDKEASTSTAGGIHPATPAATPSTNGYHGALTAENGEETGGMDIDHEAEQDGEGVELDALASNGDRQMIEDEAQGAADAAARTEHERQHLLELNLRELPEVAEEHFMPLYAIVQKVIARVFSDLQSLVEM